MLAQNSPAALMEKILAGCTYTLCSFRNARLHGVSGSDSPSGCAWTIRNPYSRERHADGLAQKNAASLEQTKALRATLAAVDKRLAELEKLVVSFRMRMDDPQSIQ